MLDEASVAGSVLPGPSAVMRINLGAMMRNDMEIHAMSKQLEAVLIPADVTSTDLTPADTLGDRLNRGWIKGGLTLRARLRALVADDRGASAIEYALIASMVAIALVTFVTPIRTAVFNIFTAIQTALTP